MSTIVHITRDLKVIKPKVAVLLAVYNGGLYIEEQVRSILKQKNVQIQIFISVDLSYDRSYDLCSKLQKKNSQITLLSYGKKYGSAAKNFFRLIRDVNLNKYEYISLADQDDIWMSDKITYAINEIIRRKVHAFSSDVIAFFTNGKETFIKKSHPQKKFDYLFESAGPGCTYVFKSKALQKFKNFLIVNGNKIHSITLHDWIIYAYFRAHNMIWHIDSKPLIKYRSHDFNHIGPNVGISALMKRYRLIKSGWYVSQVQKIININEIKNTNSFKLEKIFLLKNFLQLRRSSRDAFILLFLILLSFFKV